MILPILAAEAVAAGVTGSFTGHGGPRFRHRNRPGGREGGGSCRTQPRRGRVLNILGMALAESIAIYALILAFQGLLSSFGRPPRGGG